MDEETTLTEDQVAVVMSFVNQVNAARVGSANLSTAIEDQDYKFFPVAKDLAHKTRPTIMFKAPKSTLSISVVAAAAMRVLNDLAEQAVNKKTMFNALEKAFKAGNDGAAAMDKVLKTVDLPRYGVVNLQTFGKNLEGSTNIMNFSYAVAGYAYIMNVQRPEELVYQPYCYNGNGIYSAALAKIDWEGDVTKALADFQAARSILQASKLITKLKDSIHLVKTPIFRATALADSTSV